MAAGRSKLIRKTFWAALIIALVGGCGSDAGQQEHRTPSGPGLNANDDDAGRTNAPLLPAPHGGGGVAPAGTGGPAMGTGGASR
ncbi:MAG: hypothetical protein JWO31_1504 [Phycisphaerales bacterium]|nr:hypothetical protein [Phycisphaerales bacterium]